MGKWAVPQAALPFRADTSASTPSSSIPPLPTEPQHLSKAPPLNTLNKWTRPVPQNPESNMPSGSRPLNGPQISTQTNDHRLQRGLAPHQDPLLENNIDSHNTHRPLDKHKPRGQGSGISQQRQNLMERTFGSRPPDPRTSSRSAPPRVTPEVQDASKKILPVISSVDVIGRNARNNRPNRVVQRERGSLLARLNEGAAPSHRTRDAPKPHGPDPTKIKKRVFVEKRVSADIYIPTTVSVGTLARLLGVRLGKCFAPHMFIQC